MSLEWDIRGVRNHDAVCLRPDGTLSPYTEGIIHALQEAGIPELTHDNLEECLYRFDALFDAGKAFLHGATDEGSFPMRLRRPEVHDHIGLKIQPCKTLGNIEFDSRIRSLRIQRQLAALLDRDDLDF